MKIKIKNYMMVPSDNAKDRFDLGKVVTSKRVKTGEEYESINNIGYGMTLQNCINTIISLELDNDDRIVDLREYVNAYREARGLIMTCLDTEADHV